MRRVDIDAVIAGIVPGIRKLVSDADIAARAFVSDALKSVLSRVTSVEEQIKNLPTAKDGAPGEKGADGTNGKDAEPVDIAQIVAEVLEQIPIPKDGTPGEKGIDGISGKDGEPGERGTDGVDGKDGQNGADGAPGEKGADGESVSSADVIRDVEPLIKQLIEAIPAPKDGEAGPQGDRGEKGVDGANGRDGTDGKSITLDDIAPMMENALTKALLDFERRATDVLLRSVENMPKPKDGRDAFQLEDIEIALGEDDRTLTLAFTRDGARIERSVTLPTLKDAGVFKDGRAYTRGDGCTFGGSFWIAQKDAPIGKPGDEGSDWRLAVKSGRHGKDGRMLPALPDKVKL